MKWGFLYFCLFLVFGAWVFQALAQGSGYLLIVWGKTSIEMSLWFALLTVVAVVLIVWFLLYFFRGGFRQLVATKIKVFGVGDQKAQAKTVDGLIEFIEGNWPAARKKLMSSASKVKSPLINYLAAARSAYEMGEEQHALELLHKAETSTDKGRLAVAITQARMLFANQQYEQALASLERASAISPEHPVVLSLRKQVYTALKDWPALNALLPQLVKNNVSTSAERHQLELKIYRERFSELVEKLSSESEDQKKSKLQEEWSSIPSHLQDDQVLLSLYCSQLMALAEHDLAEKLLANALGKQWHGQWVDLYGLLLCGDSKKPLKTAEKWLKKQSKSAHLLLALGRLCVQNQQWGRATDFFEQSLALLPRAETYAELARVQDFIGETNKSIGSYKKGLLAAASVLANDRVFAK